MFVERYVGVSWVLVDVRQQVLVLLEHQDLREFGVMLHYILDQKPLAQRKHIFNMLLQRNMKITASFANYKQALFLNLHVTVGTALLQ